jgi:long-chain fatty acid transport protein
VNRKDGTMKTRFLFALSIGVVLLPNEVLAAGTALDVQGARGTGMASSTTAFINDSSAIFYNPAGIAQGKGLDAQAGLNLIIPTFRFKSTLSGNETTMPFNIVTPITAFATYGITDWLSAGVGVFTPYGLDLAWPDGWEGRSQITKASLRTYYINPTVAAHFGPVRFGAGLQVVRATVELERDIKFGNTFGSADLGGGSWGFGANAGVQVEAIPKYLLGGIAYRSAVRTDFDDGRAHFSNIPSAFQSQFFDQKVTTGVTQPDQLAIALATHPIDNLVIDAEIVWLGWHKFHSIDLNFQNTALSSSEPKNWGNRVNYHIGGEYTIDPHWQVRAGALYDPSPSPPSTLAPDIPDANRLNLALGGTYKHDSGVFFDLGYQFITLFSKTGTNPTFPGETSGLVNILAFSVGFTQTRAPTTAAPPPEPREHEEALPPGPSTPLESKPESDSSQ